MEQKKGAGRIAKWDNARWILITLVVICHFFENYLGNPVANSLFFYVYTFHMPAFFFLSGICMKREGSWKVFAKKRFQRMVGWQILLAGICMGYDFIQSHSINFVSNLFVWFLPVLFCSEIVFQILCKGKSNPNRSIWM